MQFFRFFFTQKMRWCQDHRKQLERSGFTAKDPPRANFPSRSWGWCSFKAKITQLPLRFFFSCQNQIQSKIKPSKLTDSCCCIGNSFAISHSLRNILYLDELCFSTATLFEVQIITYQVASKLWTQITVEITNIPGFWFTRITEFL